MALPDKDLIIFDLDGTLSQSKMPMDTEMSGDFMALIRVKRVAVISGGGWRQFETQFLASLPISADYMTNLVLLPTSGTRMYAWRGSWCEQYAEHLSPKEKEQVMTSLHDSLIQAGYEEPAKVWGEII